MGHRIVPVHVSSARCTLFLFLLAVAYNIHLLKRSLSSIHVLVCISFHCNSSYSSTRYGTVFYLFLAAQKNNNQNSAISQQKIPIFRFTALRLLTMPVQYVLAKFFFASYPQIKLTYRDSSRIQFEIYSISCVLYG